MNGLWEALWSLSEPGQLLRDEPMSRHTTFRIGGPADMMFFPAMEQQLQSVSLKMLLEDADRLIF